MRYSYEISLADGQKKAFDIKMDNATLNVIPMENAVLPEWTRLEYHKCTECPLKAERCPIAVNIASMVEGLDVIISSERAHVEVVTEDGRKISKDAPIQDALYAPLGIYMAASGCPFMEKLKPMAANHLPFSTVEETVYRVMTMYLAAQYFRMKAGEIPDWDLKGLVEMYEKIRMVNGGFAERLRNAAKQDSVLNSLINLDVFAMVVTDVSSNIETLKYLFKPYLKEEKQCIN